MFEVLLFPRLLKKELKKVFFHHIYDISRNDRSADFPYETLHRICLSAMCSHKGSFDGIRVCFDHIATSGGCLKILAALLQAFVINQKIWNLHS